MDRDQGPGDGPFDPLVARFTPVSFDGSALRLRSVVPVQDAWLTAVLAVSTRGSSGNIASVSSRSEPGQAPGGMERGRPRPAGGPWPLGRLRRGLVEQADR